MAGAAAAAVAAVDSDTDMSPRATLGGILDEIAELKSEMGIVTTERAAPVEAQPDAVGADEEAAKVAEEGVGADGQESAEAAEEASKGISHEEPEEKMDETEPANGTAAVSEGDGLAQPGGSGEGNGGASEETEPAAEQEATLEPEPVVDVGAPAQESRPPAPMQVEVAQEKAKQQCCCCVM